MVPSPGLIPVRLTYKEQALRSDRLLMAASYRPCRCEMAQRLWSLMRCAVFRTIRLQAGHNCKDYSIVH